MYSDSSQLEKSVVDISNFNTYISLPSLVEEISKSIHYKSGPVDFEQVISSTKKYVGTSCLFVIIERPLKFSMG